MGVEVWGLWCGVGGFVLIRDEFVVKVWLIFYLVYVVLV